MLIKIYPFLIVFLLIIGSCKTLSIPDNEPLDHIVLVTGDTLYGKVDYFKEEYVISEFYRKIRLTDTKGKKRRFKRKNVVSYQVDGANYESFMLKEQSRYFTNGSVMETRYVMDNDGDQHFLKVGSKGKLQLYHLEWIDRDNNDLTSMDLVKKADETYFLRSSYGVWNVAKKALSNYLSDCPEVQNKILEKDFKYVFQVVDYYNENCE